MARSASNFNKKKQKKRPVSPEEHREGKRIAEERIASHVEGHAYLVWDEDLELPVASTKSTEIVECGAWMARTSSYCTWGAGTGTAHEGVGRCCRHDTPLERSVGAWMMAHAIARYEDISPWEALLLAVKRAAAWAAFYDTKLEEAGSDDDLAPTGSHYHWVVAAERVNDKLARYSKMAVDAGVAAMLVARARTEGEQIASVLNAALGAADLSEEQERKIRVALREALLSVEESSPPGVTET